MYELDTRMGTTFQSSPLWRLEVYPASLERLKRIKVTRLRPFYATNCSLFSRYAEKKKKKERRNVGGISFYSSLILEYFPREHGRRQDHCQIRRVISRFLFSFEAIAILVKRGCLNEGYQSLGLNRPSLYVCQFSCISCIRMEKTNFLPYL